MQRAGWSHLFRPAAAAALLAFVSACGRHDDATGDPLGSAEPVAIALAPVDLRSFPLVIETTGTLYGDEEATISALVPGRVVEVLADVGDRVAFGERLAQIDPTNYRLEVAERANSLREAAARLGLQEPPPAGFDITHVPTVRRARAETANAAARMERGRQLFEQSPPLMSEQEYQDLVTTHQVAQASEAVAVLEAESLLAQVRLRQSEHATAEQRLADAAVRAPQSPRSDAPASDDLPPYAAVQRLVALGEYVSIGTPLYRLVADNPIKYRAAVPERFLQTVTRGQSVTLRLDDGGGEAAGRIERISPAVDPVTRTFLIEAVFDNPDRRLRPGSFARGGIHTGDRSGVVFVPRTAVVSFAGVDKVYGVAEGKAVEHRVSLLAREGDWLPIDQELPTDRVVVEGLTRLGNGVPVTISPSAP